MDKLLHSKVIGQGEPLVILHGLFGMLDNWQGIAKQLGVFFETHILDQRNHGKSFHDDHHNYDAMCEDLRLYLDEKQIHKIVLIGHSMGGKTAMLFAAKYPKRVKKLVIVDIAPKYYAPHHQEILTGLKDVRDSEITSRKQADFILSNHFSDINVRQFLLKNLYWKSKSELDFRFNLDVLSLEILNVGVPLSDGLTFLNPTLFIDGEQSNYILEEDQELIETHFPNSEIVTVKNVGHWVHAEDPKTFFEMVYRFLIYAS